MNYTEFEEAIEAEQICCSLRDFKNGLRPADLDVSLVKDYGEEFEGEELYYGTGGGRVLVHCKRCGRLILIMRSVFESFVSDEYTSIRVYMPVRSEAEAGYFNRNYPGLRLHSVKREKFVSIGGTCFYREDGEQTVKGQEAYELS